MPTPDLRRFYGDDLHIGIVSIMDSGQGRLLRALFENMDVAVHLTSIGTPAGFLRLIAGGQFPDYVIISCHGDDGGIEFGDYIEGIDVSALVDGCLPSKHIAERGDFAGALVVNLGCDQGGEATARDYLAAGARAYIGTEPNPDWRCHSLFLHHFFYDIVRAGLDDKKAWERAAAYDKESRYFLYYDAGGRHRAGAP